MKRKLIIRAKSADEFDIKFREVCEYLSQNVDKLADGELLMLKDRWLVESVNRKWYAVQLQENVARIIVNVDKKMLLFLKLKYGY